MLIAATAAFPAEWLEPTPPSGLETFCFEATLPGLDEELSFRGVGLACLIRAFSRDGVDGPARVLALWITALWFTAVHVVNLQHGHLVVTWHRILDVLPYGVWLAIIRFRSGSLLGGIIAHNTSNTIQGMLGEFGF